MPETDQLAETDELKPLDQKLRDEIAEGVKRMWCVELNISSAEWELLEASIHRFHRLFLDWDGYLNKGEMAEFRKIASKAAKLSSAMDQVTQRGLGKILEYELAPITSDQLFAALAVLANIDPQSPKSNDGKKQKGTCYQDDLKSDLQSEFDEWWLSNTGLPTATEESDVTPYSYVLGQVSRTLPSKLATGLGISRTAVSGRWRHAARRQARDRKIREAFKKLHSMKPPAGD